MAFTFQVNTDKFIHNEKLLAKAGSFRPAIHHTTIKPVRLLDEGRELSHIGEYALKRDDRIIIDFGRHIVGRFSVNISKTGSPQDAPLFIRVKFAEMPAELEAESSDYEGWLSRSWIQEEFVHLDELPAKLELPRRYSFRYVEIKVIDTSPKWQAVFTDPLAVSESSADYSRLKKPEISRSQ